MKKKLITLCCLLAICSAAAVSVEAAKKKPAKTATKKTQKPGYKTVDPKDYTQSKLVINVNPRSFRSNNDLPKVLHSAAGRIWKYFPHRKLKPLDISYRNAGPLAYYQRARNGNIRIGLSSSQTYWCQHAYQFAHEFCHVMCSFDSDRNQNMWFEESICEMASLFALRAMTEQWKKERVLSYADTYGKHFRNYAQDLIDKGQLPKGQTLKQWYKKNARQLFKSSTQRELNRIVAVELLPMFEAEPFHWQAIEYLNKDKPKAKDSFKTYLQEWRNNTPADHQDFIDRIAKKFGITLKKLRRRSK